MVLEVIFLQKYFSDDVSDSRILLLLVLEPCPHHLVWVRDTDRHHLTASCHGDVMKWTLHVKGDVNPTQTHSLKALTSLVERGMPYCLE